MVTTAIGSKWCVSGRAAYSRLLRSSAHFAAVPASIVDLFRCTLAKVFSYMYSETKLLLPLKGKRVILSGVTHLPYSYIEQDVPQPMAGLLFVALFQSHHSLPCTLGSGLKCINRKAMQAPSVHLPTSSTRKGNINIKPTLRADNTKALRDQWCPKRQNRPHPLSLCCGL